MCQLNVIYLTSDLLFSSRVSGLPRSLGVPVVVVRSKAALLEQVSVGPTGLVLVDLEHREADLSGLMRELGRAVPRPRVVAYGPHVKEPLLACSSASWLRPGAVARTVRQAVLDPAGQHRAGSEFQLGPGKNMTTVVVTKYYLEMLDRSELKPKRCDAPEFRIERVGVPCPKFNRFLYAAVGWRWTWIDKLLYTDGFADAESPSSRRFSETTEYEAAVAAALALPPPAARTHLEETMQKHTQGTPQDDDRAFLIAELR